MKPSKRAICIFVIAFAIRALVPPGFMLISSASASTGLQIVVCTSQGLKLIGLDEHGKPIGDDHQASHHGSCPYGPPPAALSNDFSLLLTLERIASRVEHDRQVEYRLRSRHRELRFARGPPLRALT
ncbi:MAG: DUF2946 domain-containing protein [Hyphomicrobiaceae bacterium]|nr:DUF2946 domain-containing protein [Hyphomicrobiaceae bacterium]